LVASIETSINKLAGELKWKVHSPHWYKIIKF
jgi:hypothetical protein